MKPNCYDCVHRRDVTGSAHSACGHPLTKNATRSPFMELAGIVGKRGGVELAAMADHFGEGPAAAARALHIKGVDLGIRNGWFVWPVNFDPVWLESCDGFAPRPTEAATSPDAD